MPSRFVLGVGALLVGLAASSDRPSAVQAGPPRFGFGRRASADEITTWDIDVMPDGEGLPPGSGTAREGAELYARTCAACHGRSGVEGPAEPLVGREPRVASPFGRAPGRLRTIGNYWPYATTLYDYINRAMPLNRPGSLAPGEVYGLVAYLLWRNEIIADTAVIDAHTLPGVRMPAHDRFAPDRRRGGPEIR